MSGRAMLLSGEGRSRVDGARGNRSLALLAPGAGMATAAGWSADEVVLPVLGVLRELTGMESALLCVLDDVDGRPRGTVVAVDSADQPTMEIRLGEVSDWSRCACSRLEAAGREWSSDLGADFPDLEPGPSVGPRGCLAVPVVLTNGSRYATLCGLSPVPVEVPDGVIVVARLFARLVAAHVERAMEATADATRQARHRERSRYRAAELARAGHELRSSLALVGGWSEILLDHDADLTSDRRREAAAVVERSARQLAGQLNNLLAEAATWDVE